MMYCRQNTAMFKNQKKRHRQDQTGVWGAAVTCDSENLSLASPRHLHLVYVTCDSNNLSLRLEPLLDPEKTRGRLMGWGGMLTFPGTCKPRISHKHQHTYTLNQGWGGGTAQVHRCHHAHGSRSGVASDKHLSCKRQKFGGVSDCPPGGGIHPGPIFTGKAREELL